MKDKFFILGNPRSGTTLLRLMLNAHRNMLIPPECGFIQWWYNKYGSWTRSDSLKDQKINEFLDDLFSSKKIETWELDRNKLSGTIKKNKPVNYEELTELVYLSWGREMNKQIHLIGDKNNYFIDHLETISIAWPQAKYLMIIRDGRDVACSYREIKEVKTRSKYKPHLPFDIKDIAFEWITNNNNILNFILKRPDKYHIIQYEHLIESTEDTLKEICNFLEVQIDMNVLKYYTLGDKYSEPVETVDWKQRTKQKPDNSRVGRYKNILSDIEIANFNFVASSLLTKFGYTDID